MAGRRKKKVTKRSTSRMSDPTPGEVVGSERPDVPVAEPTPQPLQEEEVEIPKPAAEPYYLVSTPRGNGMWRIGRRFTREPTKILASELTEAQRKVLDEEPKWFDVERVGFES
jgi:hypothetical protein